MRISFHGAADGVTGSCHLIEAAGKRILVDCGLFQGSRALRDDNADPFGFEPADIDVVLLTHAHLDHTGRLPLLVKRGFRGRIIATAATRDLARIVLLDAAGLQEEEARRSNKKAHRAGADVVEPLYGTVDALDTIDHFRKRGVSYGEWVELGDGVRAVFDEAGHILGSASLCIEAQEEGRTRRAVFSGDIGSAARPIVRDPAPPRDADVIVMESTYGDRDHRGFEESIDELYGAVRDGLERGGNVFIPSFALERAQELLVAFNEGIAAGKLPASMRVFLDSPMAISATEIYRRHPECYDEETKALFDKSGGDPFALPHLIFARDRSQSRAINEVGQGAVVMAGSGMCTGGRIMHHLKHNLWRAECTFIFVSYAGQGTLARAIIERADRVRIFDRDVQVRAQVHTINGFSAHAGRSELLAWREGASNGAQTVLVHGDADAREALAGDLAARGHHVVRPHMHDVLEL